MFCTNCGAELREDAAFCVECGTRVASDFAAPSSPVVPNSNAPVVPSSNAPASPSSNASASTPVSPSSNAPAATSVITTPFANHAAPAQSRKSPIPASQGAQTKTAKRRIPVAIIVAAAVVLVAALTLVLIFVVRPFGSSSDEVVAFGSDSELELALDDVIVPSETKNAPYDTYRVRIAEAYDADNHPIDVFDYPQLDVRSAEGFCMRDFDDDLPEGTYTVVTTCNGTSRRCPPICVKASSANAAQSSSDASDSGTSERTVYIVAETEDSQAGEADVQTEAKNGKYAAFLEVLQQLQEQYGEPGARINSSRSTCDVWGTGLCFADLIDFGDGVECLVAAYCTDTNATKSSVKVGAYTLEVYEYDDSSDAATRIFRSTDAISALDQDASAGFSYTNGFEITNGGYRYLHIVQDESGKRYLMGMLNDVNDYYRFFGLGDSGTFTLLKNFEANTVSWPTLEYFIDGEETDEATWEAQRTALVAEDSTFALCGWGDKAWAESAGVLGGGSDGNEYSPTTSASMAKTLIGSLTRVTSDSDENVKVIGSTTDEAGVTDEADGADDAVSPQEVSEEDAQAASEDADKQTITAFLTNWLDSWKFDNGQFTTIDDNYSSTQDVGVLTPYVDPASSLYSTLEQELGSSGDLYLDAALNVRDIRIEKTGEGAYRAEVDYFATQNYVTQEGYDSMIANGPATLIFAISMSADHLIEDIALED